VSPPCMNPWRLHPLINNTCLEIMFNLNVDDTSLILSHTTPCYSIEMHLRISIQMYRVVRSCSPLHEVLKLGLLQLSLLNLVLPLHDRCLAPPCC